MTSILEGRNKKQNVLDRLEKWVEKQFRSTRVQHQGAETMFIAKIVECLLCKKKGIKRMRKQRVL